MIRISAKSYWSFVIALPIFLLLPVIAFFGFRYFMARMITRDNAGIVFEQFQVALDKGAIIRDPMMAADVAELGYRDRMHGLPVDGWGHPFRIEGSISGNSCVLTVQSAGPDGSFGTGDDVSLSQTFELHESKAKPSTHGA
jgi:hypothetical protein